MEKIEWVYFFIGVALFVIYFIERWYLVALFMPLSAVMGLRTMQMLEKTK